MNKNSTWANDGHVFRCKFFKENFFVYNKSFAHDISLLFLFSLFLLE